MDSLEKEGKTVEEAVELALTELGLAKDEVKVEVLSEPNKGFLGMVGGRLAKVRVTPDQSSLHARSILSNLLRLMHIEATIEELETEDEVKLKVDSPDSALLIGKKGKNLNAIQYLVNRMYNHGRLKRRRIVIDIESYLERRKESLEDLARRIAEKVKKTGRQVKLEALNPQDRRSVHLALQNDAAVRTFSIGSGAYRNVVIAPADEQDDYNKKQHE